MHHYKRCSPNLGDMSMTVTKTMNHNNDDNDDDDKMNAAQTAHRKTRDFRRLLVV